MKMYLYGIFSAFVYTFAREINKEKKTFNQETDFVFKQFQNMPWYFILPFSLLTITLTHTMRSGGRPFHKLEEELRVGKLYAIKKNKFGVIKDFIKFFNSLTNFAYYSYL
jgi:hypothetical protein